VDWSADDIPDQTGRVAIVTGANSGIGYETALALARKGARVILACRDPGRGSDAERRLRAAAPSADVRFAPLDLGSLGSVADFAKRVEGEETKLDVLCNNAGVMVPPYGKTADGFELQFGTNHLGHFALTGRLLPLLRRAKAPRVVAVSSTAHRMGGIDFDDLQWERRKYSPWRAYGASKLANLLFARELARRMEARGEPLVAAGAHPGATQTNLQQHSGFSRVAVALFSQAPPGGALPTLYAATAPDVKGGDYFGPGRLMELVGPPKPAYSSAASKDVAAAKRLWEVSERLTQVAYGI
jgi:NAD(P)-dependent dehydrogenase (short-subunit alcohol dehydrogenase family)